MHRLLKAINVPDIPPMSKAGCTQFVADRDRWWGEYTNCQAFAKQSNASAKRFHGEVETDGVSVSVLVFHPNPPSPSEPPPPHMPASAQRRKRQRQQDTMSDSQWVKGLPSHSIDQAQRIVGLDPGRKSLFTAAVHSQAARQNLQEMPLQNPHEILSCSSSRWHESSGTKLRSAKTDKWLQSNEALRSALGDMPTAKVASTEAFLQHIKYRLQHLPTALGHFGNLRHKKLLWTTHIKHQQAYTVICRDICRNDSSTVVAYGDASFSSSCCKGNPSTPTVSLRRKLGQCCKVYNTDEFRTSMLCCACKSRMDGMTLPLTGNTSCQSCSQAADVAHRH